MYIKNTWFMLAFIMFMTNTSSMELILHNKSSMSLSYFWNIGSMLLMFMVLQVLSGIILTFFYTTNMGFITSTIFNYNIDFGYIIRMIHANYASIIFLLVYLHIAKAIINSSFSMVLTWLSGYAILMLLMIIAFMGYILPLSSMSYWAAKVITNLLSVIPMFGLDLVQMLWSGFSINLYTINMMYSIHYVLPLIMMLLALLHMVLLHSYLSSSMTNNKSSVMSINFSYSYIVKDLMNIPILVLALALVSIFPMLMIDSEMSLAANTMSSPIHIIPEWYYLFMYAILRSITNKMIGVIMFGLSVIVLCLAMSSMSISYHHISSLLLLVYSFNLILLTFMGMMMAEEPFVMLSFMLTSMYFILLTIMMLAL